MDVERKHERDRKRYRAHKKRVSEQSASRYFRYKLTVLRHYSHGNPKCNRCGVTDTDVLVIDHINDDGKIDRKVRGMGTGFYRALINELFPPGFQVLCFNCNHKKEVERRRSERGS